VGSEGEFYLIARIKIWGAAAVLFAVSLLAAMGNAKRKGRKEAVADMDAKANAARLENIERARDHETEIASLDADDRARRFDGLWK
jgi:hypothetical protein